MKVPRETGGPGEGRGDWEAPGPTGGEGEAWAPEGLMGVVCM